MNRARRATVTAIGVIMGLGGVEHGIGEILEGNIAPKGLVFPSWPDSPFFRIVAGEPAMTIIPNLLVTGILAILFSLIFLVWVAAFIQRKNGGLVMILLSIVMLLVGGGIFPPILGILMGIVGTQINGPLTWWRTHLSAGWQHFLARLWPWSFGACLAAWLLMFPGLCILDYFFGVSDPNLASILFPFAFGSLVLTILIGFAHDVQRQTDSHQIPATMSGRPVSQVGS